MKYQFQWLLCFLLLWSCVPEDEANNEQQNQYQECEKGLKCSPSQYPMKVVVTRSDFPSKIQLLIDDKVVFDECDINSMIYKVSRGISITTIEVAALKDIDDESQINFALRNLGSCYENTIYYSKNSQPFEIKKISGQKVIWIEIN